MAGWQKDLAPVSGKSLPWILGVDQGHNEAQAHEDSHRLHLKMISYVEFQNLQFLHKLWCKMVGPYSGNKLMFLTLFVYKLPSIHNDEKMLLKDTLPFPRMEIVLFPFHISR